MAESSRSFALFAEAVVELAREHGWPRNRVQLVAHSAWAMEHGLATLILGDRVRNIAHAGNLEQMIDLSISMMLSAIVAGPANFRLVKP